VQAAPGVRPPLVPQLLLGLLVFVGYSAVAGLHGAARDSAALGHARDVLGLERALHLDVVPALNAWLAPHEVLRTLADYEYAITYVISAFALIFWVWARRPELFRWARDSFVLLNVVAIACFALYPVTPPRLVPGLDLVDTVRAGHTVGSWGSPLVAHANQLAAMPSLHFAWALWVSVVLAYIAGGWRTQLVSAVHVLVTLFVILATANHYVLDAVAGAALAWGAVAVVDRLRGREHVPGALVPSADAFFLHVESPAAPQHVGGVVLLDTIGCPDPSPSRDDVEAVVRAQLHRLPRFQQMLSGPTRWRRARWVDAPELDWSWHVTARDVRTDPPAGFAAGSWPGAVALDAVVAEIASVPLPRDRPLWRLVLVHGLEPDLSAVVFVVHHVVADGIGTVSQALHLLEPALPEPPLVRGPSRGATALATVAGLAQLATDGPSPHRVDGVDDASRRFGRVVIPLDEVRAVARAHGARVTDLLMAVVAGGLRRVWPEDRPVPPRLRVAVPLTVRDPRSAQEGNVTAAVMADIPLDHHDETERLTAVTRRSARLRSGTRAVASRFVMQVAGVVMPVPLHAWFARTVYGRRFFSGIVSNMPGPDLTLSLAGVPLAAAFPLLPLAPGTPLAVGALGWDGSLCLGVAAHPGLLPDLAAFDVAVREAFAELKAAAGGVGPVEPVVQLPGDSVRPGGRLS
jgi:hypothetical protein